jgi:hypothetical protein
MSKLSLLVVALATAVASAAPCPPSDLFGQSLGQVIDGKLAFCDVPATSCWVLDGAAWTARPHVADQTVTVTATGVTSCAAGGKDCITLPTTAFADGGTGTANEDRSLVAAWYGTKFLVFDTAGKKLLYSVGGWKSGMGSAKEAQFQGAQFAGKALVVWESESPVSSSGWLVNARTGKRIGAAVKANLETEPWAVQVDKTHWAIPGFSPKLYLVDATTGKATKTLALPGSPGSHALVGKLADGRLVVTFEGVTLVDPATGKATAVPAPTCAK